MQGKDGVGEGCLKEEAGSEGNLPLRHNCASDQPFAGHFPDLHYGLRFPCSIRGSSAEPGPAQPLDR